MEKSGTTRGGQVGLLGGTSERGSQVSPTRISKRVKQVCLPRGTSEGEQPIHRLSSSPSTEVHERTRKSTRKSHFTDSSLSSAQY